MILATFFMTKIGRYWWNNVISKISVDSNILFTSYTWLCALILLHRLLCLIKSRTQEFLQKLLLFHPEIISAQFLWENVFLSGELFIDVKNSNFKILESALYMKSVSMPLRKFKKCCQVPLPFSNVLPPPHFQWP